MPGLWKAYLRWRHSLGFGVHSPYAYRFVKDVISPGKYGYYAYENLGKKISIHHPEYFDFYKYGKLIVRILNFLKIKELIVFPTKDPIGTEVANACGIRLRNLDNKHNSVFKKDNLLWINGSIPEKILRQAVDEGIPVVALHPDKNITKLMETPIKNGVLFSGKEMLVLIPRQEMEYISYDVKF